MRLILRLIVLAFAALGVKTLYDKFAGRSDELQATGNDAVDRGWTAARDVQGMASDAAQHVASTARASADGVKQAASDNAATVKGAAMDLKDAPTT
jgi:hypothetical protein